MLRPLEGDTYVCLHIIRFYQLIHADKSATLTVKLLLKLSI